MIYMFNPYQWLRIEGESFRVRRDDFMGMPVYTDPRLTPGTIELQDSCGNVMARIVSCLDSSDEDVKR